MAQKPGVRERLGLALKYFRGGWPAISPMGIESKAAPFLWPSWRNQTPQWSIINASNYIAEGWEHNSVIYAAIAYKMRAAQLAPLRAYHGTPEEPERLPPEAPLSRLCARPNPWQSWESYAGIGEVYLNLLGNDFIFLDRKDAEIPGIPASLYHLRPDRVTIVPDTRRNRAILGYIYVPEGRSWQDGVPILAEDMIHVKFPNPGDPLEGLGWGLPPLAAAAQSADVDNDVTKYLKVFFDEGAMPPGLLSTDVSMLTSADIARMRDRWRESYGGVEHWNEPVIMEKGMTYQRLALSFQEMGFEALDGRNESRIAAPFGVPLILLETRGALSAATFTNKVEARKMFWQDTMRPELSLYQGEYAYYLNPQDGSFVQYDLSQVPALQTDIAALAEAAYKLWQMGEPRYRAYDIVGLRAVSVDDESGWRSYTPIGVIASGDEPRNLLIEEPDVPDHQDSNSAGSPAPEEPEEDERRGESAGHGPPRIQGDHSHFIEPGQKENSQSHSVNRATRDLAVKERFYKMTNRLAEQWEPAFAQAMNNVFEAQKRAMLSLISDAKNKARENKATLDWENVSEYMDDYLEMAGDDWRNEFLPVLRGVVIGQGENLAAMLGIRFDVRNLMGEQWFDTHIYKFAQPINKTTTDGLSVMFKQAMKEGWSIPTMSKRMTELFDRWQTGKLPANEFQWFEDRKPTYRKVRIARTETIRAANAGSTQLMGDWGVQRKEWYATADARTRDAHQIGAAWGQAPLVVAMNEGFFVGGEKLMFPGDPAGKPENTINCRCTTLPVLDEGQIVNPAGETLPPSPPEPTPQEGPDRFPEEGFTHLKKAKEWAMRAYPHIDWDFDGADIRTINPTLRQWDILAQKYPKAIEKISYFGTYQGKNSPLPKFQWGQNTWAHHMRHSATRRFIGINPRYFNHPELFLHGLQDSVFPNRDGTTWHVQGGDTIESVMTHEFGHVLHHWYDDIASGDKTLMYSGVVDSIDGTGYVGRTGKRFFTSIRPDATLSRYAVTNGKEGFAEGFTAIHHSNPVYWDDYTKRLDKMIRMTTNEDNWTRTAVNIAKIARTDDRYSDLLEQVNNLREETGW